MNHTRRIAKISSLVLLSLLLGSTGVALAANYPPAPAEIIKVVPPLVKGNVVVTPTAPESHLVYTLTLVKPTAANLANLTDQAKPKPVQITAGLIMGGIKLSADVPRVTVNSKTKASSEVQTVADVPTSISLTGYKAGQKVTITAIQGSKVVVIGTFTAGKTGILVLPAVTLTGDSSVKLSMKSSSGTKSLTMRSVASKSKTSTSKVKIAK